METLFNVYFHFVSKEPSTTRKYPGHALVAAQGFRLTLINRLGHTGLSFACLL